MASPATAAPAAVASPPPLSPPSRASPPTQSSPRSATAAPTRAAPTHNTCAMVLSWLRTSVPNILQDAGHRSQPMHDENARNVLVSTLSDAVVLADLVSLLDRSRLPPSAILRATARNALSAPVPQSPSAYAQNIDARQMHVHYKNNTRRTLAAVKKLLDDVREYTNFPHRPLSGAVDAYVGDVAAVPPSRDLRPALRLAELVIATAVYGPRQNEFRHSIWRLPSEATRAAFHSSMSAVALAVALPPPDVLFASGPPPPRVARSPSPSQSNTPAPSAHSPRSSTVNSSRPPRSNAHHSPNQPPPRAARHQPFIPQPLISPPNVPLASVHTPHTRAKPPPSPHSPHNQSPSLTPRQTPPPFPYSSPPLPSERPPYRRASPSQNTSADALRSPSQNSQASPRHTPLRPRNSPSATNSSYPTSPQLRSPRQASSPRPQSNAPAKVSPRKPPKPKSTSDQIVELIRPSAPDASAPPITEDTVGPLPSVPFDDGMGGRKFSMVTDESSNNTPRVGSAFARNAPGAPDSSGDLHAVASLSEHVVETDIVQSMRALEQQHRLQQQQHDQRQQLRQQQLRAQQLHLATPVEQNPFDDHAGEQELAGSSKRSSEEFFTPNEGTPSPTPPTGEKKHAQNIPRQSVQPERIAPVHSELSLPSTSESFLRSPPHTSASSSRRPEQVLKGNKVDEKVRQSVTTSITEQISRTAMLDNPDLENRHQQGAHMAPRLFRQESNNSSVGNRSSYLLSPSASDAPSPSNQWQISRQKGVAEDILSPLPLFSPPPMPPRLSRSAVATQITPPPPPAPVLFATLSDSPPLSISSQGAHSALEYETQHLPNRGSRVSFAPNIVSPSGRVRPVGQPLKKGEDERHKARLSGSSAGSESFSLPPCAAVPSAKGALGPYGAYDSNNSSVFTPKEDAPLSSGSVPSATAIDMHPGSSAAPNIPGDMGVPMSQEEAFMETHAFQQVKEYVVYNSDDDREQARQRTPRRKSNDVAGSSTEPILAPEEGTLFESGEASHHMEAPEEAEFEPEMEKENEPETIVEDEPEDENELEDHFEVESLPVPKDEKFDSRPQSSETNPGGSDRDQSLLTTVTGDPTSETVAASNSGKSPRLPATPERMASCLASPSVKSPKYAITPELLPSAYVSGDRPPLGPKPTLLPSLRYARGLQSNTRFREVPQTPPSPPDISSLVQTITEGRGDQDDDSDDDGPVSTMEPSAELFQRLISVWQSADEDSSEQPSATIGSDHHMPQTERSVSQSSTHESTVPSRDTEGERDRIASPAAGSSSRGRPRAIRLPPAANPQDLVESLAAVEKRGEDIEEGTSMASFSDAFSSDDKDRVWPDNGRLNSERGEWEEALQGDNRAGFPFSPPAKEKPDLAAGTTVVTDESPVSAGGRAHRSRSKGKYTKRKFKSYSSTGGSGGVATDGVYVKVDKKRLDWLTRELLAARDSISRKELQMTFAETQRLEQEEILLLEREDAESVVEAMRRILADREGELQDARNRLTVAIQSGPIADRSSVESKSSAVGENLEKLISESHAKLHSRLDDCNKRQANAKQAVCDEMRGLWTEVQRAMFEKMSEMTEKRDEELAALRQELESRERHVRDLQQSSSDLIDQNRAIQNEASELRLQKDKTAHRYELEMAHVSAQVELVNEFSKKLHDNFRETENLRQQVLQYQDKLSHITSTSGVSQRQIKELREAVTRANDECARLRREAENAKQQSMEAMRRAEELEELRYKDVASRSAGRYPDRQDSGSYRSHEPVRPAGQNRPGGSGVNARYHGASRSRNVAVGSGTPAQKAWLVIKDKIGGIVTGKESSSSRRRVNPPPPRDESSRGPTQRSGSPGSSRSGGSRPSRDDDSIPRSRSVSRPSNGSSSTTRSGPSHSNRSGTGRTRSPGGGSSPHPPGTYGKGEVGRIRATDF